MLLERRGLVVELSCGCVSVAAAGFAMLAAPASLVPVGRVWPALARRAAPARQSSRVNLKGELGPPFVFPVFPAFPAFPDSSRARPSIRQSSIRQSVNPSIRQSVNPPKSRQVWRRRM